MFVQRFEHVKGGRTALIRLLVEKAERGNFVLVLWQIVSKLLDRHAGLRFGLLGKPREGYRIGVGMVDDLLALAAGIFDFVTWLRRVEWRTRLRDLLGTGGGNFFGQQGVFVAADALRLGGGWRGLDDSVRVERADQPLAQLANRNALALLCDPGLRLGVQVLGQSDQTVAQTQHSVVVVAVHCDALQPIFQRHAGLLL